jgi:hypothetical protein
MSLQVSPPKPLSVTVDHTRDSPFAPRKPIERSAAMYEKRLKAKRLAYELMSPPRVSVEESSVDELFGADDTPTDKVIIGTATTPEGNLVFLFDDNTYYSVTSVPVIQ